MGSQRHPSRGSVKNFSFSAILFLPPWLYTLINRTLKNHYIQYIKFIKHCDSALKVALLWDQIPRQHFTHWNECPGNKNNENPFKRHDKPGDRHDPGRSTIPAVQHIAHQRRLIARTGNELKGENSSFSPDEIIDSPFTPDYHAAPPSTGEIISPFNDDLRNYGQH